MGKTKQAKENKKFDRNVEISAPILDPELIKAIHSPPKGQRLDARHSGFKALLSDLNSQDSIDELTPLNDNHIPSYIGISCAVSGYSNYSSYNKRDSPIVETATTGKLSSNVAQALSNSRTTSPVARRGEHQVHHITIDKNNIQSVEDERRELTEKLTASATEHRRSPSPCIPPTEDDRHHGAYVGARYCPLPAPDKLVNKHIPLLGIDDEKNPDEIVEDEHKVEQKIASLYGENFVEDWKESMTHKTKKELSGEKSLDPSDHAIPKCPKDLVNLKPTPQPEILKDDSQIQEDVPVPDVKVLASVEKKFLNKLLTDDNPPMPSSPSPISQIGHAKIENKTETITAEPTARSEVSSSPVDSPIGKPRSQPTSPVQHATSPTPSAEIPASPEHQVDVNELEPSSGSHAEEEHIEYEIRAQSPVDNQSSPVRIPQPQQIDHAELEEEAEKPQQNLVSFSPEPLAAVIEEEEVSKALLDDVEQTHKQDEASAVSTGDKDGHSYLALLEEERSFIRSKIEETEITLAEKEAELDEDTVGKIRSAIGKANLLINKKCNQFKELCEANINMDKNEEFMTLNEDLAGFWDMLLIQINDVKKSFDTLWDVKVESNRAIKTEASESIEGLLSSESNNNHSTSKHVLSAQKDQERRDRLKEHIEQMKRNQSASSNVDCYIATKNEETKVDLDSLAEEEQSKGDVEGERSHFSVDEEAEEQLFSLMGTTSPLPKDDAPEVEQQIQQSNEKGQSMEADLVDLTD